MCGCLHVLVLGISLNMCMCAWVHICLCFKPGGQDAYLVLCQQHTPALGKTSGCFVQASTAVNLGFMVFIAGWIMQVVILFGYPYTPDYYRDVVVGTVLFTLLPWYISLALHHVSLRFCATLLPFE